MSTDHLPNNEQNKRKAPGVPGSRVNMAKSVKSAAKSPQARKEAEDQRKGNGRLSCIS